MLLTPSQSSKSDIQSFAFSDTHIYLLYIQVSISKTVAIYNDLIGRVDRSLGRHRCPTTRVLNGCYTTTTGGLDSIAFSVCPYPFSVWSDDPSSPLMRPHWILYRLRETSACVILYSVNYILESLLSRHGEIPESFLSTRGQMCQPTLRVLKSLFAYLTGGSLFVKLSLANLGGLLGASIWLGWHTRPLHLMCPDRGGCFLSDGLVLAG